MNFNKIELLIPVIIFMLLFVHFFRRYKDLFFKWVFDHWNYNESKSFRLSELLFIVGFISLGVLLLDPRGEARKVKADIQNQKTIIMIDTSASMLVEDVRPNRLGKAIMLAKHFVKNAIGQQIAIMVFSDTYKKIVPFTSDIDLLEARLDSLESLQITAGGTALQLSIQEALQYLKVETKSEPSGNILVFTDAEENELKSEIKLPENVSLALVGIGTAKGGVIPIRDRKGVFKTNKKFKGKLVISKLDETALKNITEEVPVGKYWIASNYSIPTTSILNFFSRSQKEREKRGQVLIKPIMVLPFFIIFFVMFIFSTILKFKKPYILSLILFVSLSAIAQNQEEKEPEEPKTNEERVVELKEKEEADGLNEKEEEELERLNQVIMLENRLLEGNLSEDEKKDLAYLYLKNNQAKNANKLYQEVPISAEEISARFNKAKSMLLNQQFKKGLKDLNQLKEDIKNNPKMDEIRKNINSEILNHIKRHKEQKKQQKEQEKKNQEKSEKEKKSGSSGSGESEENKKKEQQKKDKENENKKKNNKKDGDNKNQNKPDEKSKNEENKSSRSKQRMKLKKLPALLKQLMSEDRNLQKKLLDTSTEKSGNQNKKDW